MDLGSISNCSVYLRPSPPTSTNMTSDNWYTPQFRAAVKAAVENDRDHWWDYFWEERRIQGCVDNYVNRMLPNRIRRDISDQLPQFAQGHLGIVVPRMVKENIDTFLPLLAQNDEKIRAALQLH